MTNVTTKTAKPFIIWTLQRTGGTNLTARLVQLSGLSATEHEPFNQGRKYGKVTEAWKNSQNENALKKSMTNIVAEKSIIKHCVEMVPWEVTRALAVASVQAGYNHLFLYREQARDRLLSLHFAKSTGVWGPNMARSEILNDTLSEPIHIETMLKHEKKCITRLGQAWNTLIDLGAQPLALSYEEIYRSSPAEAESKIQPVLVQLGLSRTQAEDHAFVLEVLGNGDQGTRDKYANILGVNELEEALKGLANFTPRPTRVS